VRLDSEVMETVNRNIFYFNLSFVLIGVSYHKGTLCFNIGNCYEIVFVGTHYQIRAAGLAIDGTL
jgi:hypothetical protein